nr:MAG TPA: hypothetical protein [Caudoviricetes sp.]
MIFKDLKAPLLLTCCLQSLLGPPKSPNSACGSGFSSF